MCLSTQIEAEWNRSEFITCTQTNLIVLCLPFSYGVADRVPFSTPDLWKATREGGEDAPDEVALVLGVQQEGPAIPAPGARHGLGQRAPEGSPERPRPAWEECLSWVFQEKVSTAGIHTFGKTWVIAFPFSLSFAHPPGEPGMCLPPVGSKRFLWVKTQLFIQLPAFCSVVPMIVLQGSCASILFWQRSSEDSGRKAVMLFGSIHFPPCVPALHLHSLLLRAVVPHSPFYCPSYFVHGCELQNSRGSSWRPSAPIPEPGIPTSPQEGRALTCSTPTSKSTRSLAELAITSWAATFLQQALRKWLKEPSNENPQCCSVPITLRFFQSTLKTWLKKKKRMRKYFALETKQRLRKALENCSTQLRVMHVFFS